MLSDEDQVIAALLHDAVEDQGGEARLADICNRFGAKVADIVESCSDSTSNTAGGEAKEDWYVRKERYLRDLHAIGEDKLLVALSDKVHNARSILRDRRKEEIGELVWQRFSQPKERTIWYYEELVNTFKKVLPGQLADELEEIVKALKC